MFHNDTLNCRFTLSVYTDVLHWHFELMVYVIPVSENNVSH